MVGLSLMTASSGLAATRVTLQDLKEHPEPYYGQTVLLECYYDKESPIWVRALPDAEEWIGFFVTGKPDKALTWSGEYYNLLFAPYAMWEVVRTLRGGDKITVIGECFPYHSMSLEGAGIRVQQLLSGWGSSAKLLGQTEATARIVANEATMSSPASLMNSGSASGPEVSEKYTVLINGKRYEGLRFGDRYDFDGVQFQVEPSE